MGRALVVEADGGSRGNPGVAGYGALVRDARTKAVLWEGAAPLGTASNNVAEYSGLIAGLRAVRRIDPAADVEVRMDSKLVVEQMAGRWKIKHADMRRLALEARDEVAELSRAGGSVRYTWVPREQNKAADALSNTGMDGGTVDRMVGDAASPDAGTDEAAEAATEEIIDPAPLTSLATEAPPDLGTPTRVLLIRHGVTDFTVASKLDGRGGADPSLNAQGQAQAQAAGTGHGPPSGRERGPCRDVLADPCPRDRCGRGSRHRRPPRGRRGLRRAGLRRLGRRQHRGPGPGPPRRAGGAAQRPGIRPAWG